jgi:hypothetical protein
MRRLIPILLLIPACAGPWKSTYTAGAVTAQFVTDTHRIAWSEPLRERADECESRLDYEVDTQADFDECLGVYAQNDQVLEALEVYNAASEVLEQALLATDPEKPDRVALISAWADVLDAALHLLALFPEAEKLAGQLQTLTAGLGR